MSEIKNVPSPTGGPCVMEELQRQENRNSERSVRFKEVARHIREKRLDEQKSATPADLAAGSASSVESIVEAIRRKTQFRDPAVPPVAGAAQGPSLQQLFSGTASAQPALANPGASPIFTPTFMTGVANVNTATGSASPLNPMYFATPETTAWLIQQKLPELGFPGAQPFLKSSGSNGGPFVANQQELWIKLPDGTEINAGMLADYYVRNPEGKF